MQSLANHFLIAMPQLADPNFFHSVTYICEHNEDGALGLVINRPLDLKLHEVFEQMGIPAEGCERLDQIIFSGGPVQPQRGFILHGEPLQWESTATITDHLAITTSRDILEAIARNEGPNQCLIALGYAGWGAGQLEQELADNAWLSGPANADIVFDTPVPERWHAAAATLGIDLDRLSGDAGHA